MKQPLISVIVPVYNVEKYLDRCIESIVNQTYKSLEIIIIDDGSPDKCPKICDYWAEKDNRVKVIHKENGGVSSARNSGLDQACGEFIGFVDGDDWIESDMYEYLYNSILASNAEISVCRYRNVDENGSFLAEYHYMEQSIYTMEKAVEKVLLDEISCVLCDKLFQRNLFENIRFKKDLYIGEDALVLYQALEKCNIISYNNGIKYNYMKRAESAWNSEYSANNKKHLGMLTLLDSIKPLVTEINSKCRAAYYYRVCNLNQLLLKMAIRAKDEDLVNISRVNIKKSLSKIAFTALRDSIRVKVYIAGCIAAINLNLYKKIMKL